MSRKSGWIVSVLIILAGCTGGTLRKQCGEPERGDYEVIATLTAGNCPAEIRDTYTVPNQGVWYEEPIEDGCSVRNTVSPDGCSLEEVWQCENDDGTTLSLTGALDQEDSMTLSGVAMLTVEKTEVPHSVICQGTYAVTWRKL